MDPLQLEVIDANHTHLVASLRANDVIDWLLKEGAINRFEYDQLRRTEPQGARAMNRLLILTLRRKGGNAYPALLRAMRSSGQDHLCDVILSSEHGIRDGMQADMFEQKYVAMPLIRSTNGFGTTALDVPGTSAAALGAGAGPRQPIRSPLTPCIHGNENNRSLWSSHTGQQGKADTPSSAWQPSLNGENKTPPPSPQRVGKPYISREPSLEFRPKETLQNSREASAQFQTNPALAYSGNPRSEAEVQRLEKELREMRQSQNKTESELRQKIEQLEKDRDGKQKQKNCSIM